MKAETIGQIERLTRYPIKSMAGLDQDVATLGWHGLEGDRRFAFRRVAAHGDFPWLTASSHPQLLRYVPTGLSSPAHDSLPTAVKSPTGKRFSLDEGDLTDELSAAAEQEVDLMTLKHGIFDDAVLSLLTTDTSTKLCNEAGIEPDPRRFRANIVVSVIDGHPFQEDAWVGRSITFGDSSQPPTIDVIKRDIRCKMIGLHPDTAEFNPDVIQAAIRLNDNYAGVYAKVVTPGTLRVGDAVRISDSK